MSVYKNPVCKGSWALGTACGKCERCEETRPMTTHSDKADDLVERLTLMPDCANATEQSDIRTEAAATIKELKAEVEALGREHDTATREWALAEARAAKAEEALVDLAELSGEFGISLPMRVRNALAAIPKITGKALGEEKA